ncbi:MAG: electron transport complex subunit RsxG [Gammaproteobacteria bacterium]|nr:electron transport complex subunit RsxG [Gammaproteobacteria bacterium]MBT3722797.1 electron transport complex subunit RsxG [Gammaproteobacteria bacterium]MBT4076622.1 electron transport complex subunit RsxG [Gammaproteobacteria bacterium]MBT4193454.1 electron transport complex subunit RsxG [Gammaproteobacteria bacterium]MBT4450371.1 electron transport complex subunit RsxG [Gammaproteobacteria bacterium]
MMISGFLLWFFSVIGTTLVAFTQQNTLELIAANEKKVLLRNLYALIPSDQMDNDIALDTLQVTPSNLLGTDSESIVYRARKQDEPVAVVFNTIAPGGYSGNIYLLIAVYDDGTLAGVRAVKHNETPGLGDAIEIRKSEWILGFDGKSLIDPIVDFWKVKRDGGHFDQITGATITPRAIVKAVKNTLDYYELNRKRLYQ